MGYAVLHLEKAKGTDSRMSAHIERTVHPKNADRTRTHLNRELVQFPEGVRNRTQAIAHRIETAGIRRKVSANQVKAIRILLTGSNKDMKQMEAEGRIEDWCNDSLKWIRETYGEQNLVSAVLHMDEKTPHIHATVIPIVTGERRKAGQEEQNGKKKYRKKNPQDVRLCADDVMARHRLKHYQDTYAQAMNKYGLQRGVDGSLAKHISTMQYYKQLVERKYSINSLVYWVTYVHNVVYSFYRSMIYCYINSTQRCAGSIVIDIIPTNGADKRKFFPFAPYFPVTNVIKRYFYPYFPAIIGIKGYSFPYFPYLSGIMKIKTALYSLFSRLDWHKTVVFPCLGEIYEGIRSLSWEIPVT
jgi:hypothetical protein